MIGKDQLIFNIKENDYLRSARSFSKVDPFEDKTFNLYAINTDMVMESIKNGVKESITYVNGIEGGSLCMQIAVQGSLQTLWGILNT